jgi:hypothetical protein
VPNPTGDISYPVDLIPVVGLEDYARDDALARSGLKYHFDLAEEDVVFGDNCGSIVFLGDHEAGAGTTEADGVTVLDPIVDIPVVVQAVERGDCTEIEVALPTAGRVIRASCDDGQLKLWDATRETLL